MTGYFLVARGLSDHPLFQTNDSLSRKEAWLDLIEQANFAESLFRHKSQMFLIPRGSVATSYRSLAARWRWSVNRVIREINLWRNQNMIETRTEHGFLQITLCNYEFYQNPFPEDGTATETEKEQQRNSNGTLTETVTDTNQKNLKKGKNSRGTRFALDSPPHEWIQFCQTQRPDLDAGRVFDSFRDYWIARPGNAGVKLDWTATWRNWVRNEKPEKGKANGRHKTALEIAAEGIARAAARREQQEQSHPG